MYKKITIITTICYLTFFSLHATQKEPVKGLFWKISSDTTSIYLLASVLVLDDPFDKTHEIYPLRQVIENAFEESDLLALAYNRKGDFFEVSDLYKYTLNNAILDDEKILKNILPESYYKDFKKRLFFDYGINIKDLDQLKPWYIAGIATKQNYSKTGVYRSQLPLEVYFQRKNKTRKFIEIDTGYNYIDTLNSMPNDIQILAVDLSLKSTPKSIIKDFQIIFDAWKRGDIDSIETYTLEKYKSNVNLEKVNKFLIDRRKSYYANYLIRLLDVEKTSFVIVGYEYLIGKNNLLKFLNSKGYLVKQL